MNKLNYFLFFILFITISCGDDDVPTEKGDLEDIPYNPQSFEIPRPAGFPIMTIPSDNPMTVAGVNLGRHLFFDPILSADGTMSCSSCHLPEGSFTDNLALSTGIDDITGTRSSMSLINVGYFNKGLFWDGRVSSLEEQALLPVEDPIELHNTWTNAIGMIAAHDTYPTLFREAFGITDKTEITKELAAKALAQFERSLVSAGNSKFDRVIYKEQEFFSDEENNGYQMFFDTSPELPDAECGHCHNAPLFTVNQYTNNGIEQVTDLDQFPDLGRGAITGNRIDNGKFRGPSLRNIELTAPYMHDGRFQTLEEVIDHYSSGGHTAQNLDPLIRNIALDDEQKADLLAFLKTLTDTTTLNNPLYQNPF